MTRKEHSPERGRSSFDKQFNCLSDTTRRRILTALADHNRRDEREFEKGEFMSTNEETAGFEIEVYHTHLPMLANAEFINWDRDSGTITQGPNFKQIEPLLTLITDHQDELPVDWP